MLATGVAASPGAAKGQIVFTPDDAVDWAQRGRAVVLVRPFTEADDVHGFFAAQGILTAEGGKASHAALVARGMGKPCVAGAAALRIDLEARELRVGDTTLREGDLIAIDGSTGRVTADDVPLTEPEVDPNLDTRPRAGRTRTAGSACAPTPTRPRTRASAREFGAEGIGLCRTEHMFMAADRQPKMQAMIMAEDGEHRRAALAELLAAADRGLRGPVRGDGRPAGHDPPARPAAARVPPERRGPRRRARARAPRAPGRRAPARAHARPRPPLEETNPMLGTRGARLGIIAPEIYDVQVEAIIAAARTVRERTGDTPQVEIMLPLVAYEQEVRDPPRPRRARDRAHGRRRTCGR